jgi:Raf kinase inhibitor-like YbhB/YbcL family protein
MGYTATMRQTLTLTGIGFLVLLIGGYILFERKENNFQNPSPMELTSSAFTHNGLIPSKYTCDAGNTSVPLSIRNVPEGAGSLVLIATDPDIPEIFKEQRGIEEFDHWTVFNIPPATAEIEEGVEPAGVRGANGRGENKYTGPCPPPQYEPSEHRYFFTLFALDAMLDLPEGASRADVERAMEGHVLAEAELMGRYKRIQ